VSVVVRGGLLLVLFMAACQANPPGSSSVPTASANPSLSVNASILAAPSMEPASGRIVFARNDHLYLIDPNGTSESQLPPGGNECPRWSPDGKDISVTTISLGSGIFENAGQPDGQFRLLALPGPPLNLGCPVWSPDGSRLAYEGWDDTDPTRSGIYTLNAADGSDLQRLTSSPNGAHDAPGDYSADGRQLFFVRYDPNEESGPLMVVGTDGSDPQQLTRESYWGPSLSPDGQALLAARNGLMYLIAVDGSSATAVQIPLNTRMDAGGPSWSPDGSWIVFSLFTDDRGDIARVRQDGTGLFQITHDPANEEFADWAP
jgi:Tol biopolymer transport system component